MNTYQQQERRLQQSKQLQINRINPKSNKSSLMMSLPSSYQTLPYTEIKITHHPSSSQTPTPILICQLHRPGKHNAWTETMTNELVSAFGLFDQDDRVKCIIVTGHGRIFCAGADLSSGKSTFSRMRAESSSEHRDGGGRFALAVHQCRKPVIAALNGSAVGVGITMTLPMSIRLAPKTAKIGFVFARRGIVMEACSSYFLPRLLGFSKAMHLITTGATYTADHPLLNGLFSEVLDTAEQVRQRAVQLAEEIAANCSTVSWALMRDMMYRGVDSAEGTHLLDSRVIYDLFESKDNAEGVMSFLEKRNVKFEGSMRRDAPAAYPWWEAVDTRSRNQVEQDRIKSKI